MEWKQPLVRTTLLEWPKRRKWTLAQQLMLYTWHYNLFLELVRYELLRNACLVTYKCSNLQMEQHVRVQGLQLFWWMTSLCRFAISYLPDSKVDSRVQCWYVIESCVLMGCSYAATRFAGSYKSSPSLYRGWIPSPPVEATSRDTWATIYTE